MIITGGWDTLELRLIGKTNICAIDEAAFDEVYRTLQEEQMGGRAARTDAHLFKKHYAMQRT